MIFTSIKIDNLGVFLGHHEFDLRPKILIKKTKPIILFGGMNGCGKTTLFEAFKLCLYGQNAFVPSIPLVKYQETMKQRLHHHPAIIAPPDQASVELNFEYSHLGKKDEYSMKRTWNFQNKMMQESVVVIRNGTPLKDISEDMWQDFIRELIPPGFTRLFFFDGERIQALAEDTSGNIQLGEAFKDLIGLDLVERLQSDLSILTNRELTGNKTSSLSKVLASLQEELQKLKAEKNEFNVTRAGYQSEIDVINKQIEDQEHKIISEGGGFAKQRKTLLDERIKVNTQIKDIEDRLRSLAYNILPITLIPEQCEKVKLQVQQEYELSKWNAAKIIIGERIEYAISEFKKSPIFSDKKINDQIRDQFIKDLKKNIKEAFEVPEELQSIKKIHNVSVDEAQRIISWVDAIPKESETCFSFVGEYEKLTRTLQAIEENLRKVPEEDQLAPLMKNMNELRSKADTINKLLGTIDGQILSLDKVILETTKKFEKLKADLEGNTKLNSRLDMIKKINEVLADFQSKLTNERIKEVVLSLKESFHELSTKKGWVNSIEVNPNDFSVKLLDRDGHQLPKELLSAGEKQIYAVALLWALARTSGRPLPFIIDTPLGRLDSDHRRSLVTSFFPQASHQVIIFSTDTEIDKNYFESLTGSIAQCYYLDFQRDLGATKVTRGYFWRRDEEVD